MDSQARHGSRPRGRARAGGPGRGEWLVRAGAALFGAGVLAVLVMVLAFFLQRTPPFPVDVLATLTPVGLAVALVGLLRGARSPR